MDVPGTRRAGSRTRTRSPTALRLGFLLADWLRETNLLRPFTANPVDFALGCLTGGYEFMRLLRYQIMRLDGYEIMRPYTRIGVSVNTLRLLYTHSERLVNARRACARHPRTPIWKHQSGSGTRLRSDRL